MIKNTHPRSFSLYRVQIPLPKAECVCVILVSFFLQIAPFALAADQPTNEAPKKADPTELQAARQSVMAVLNDVSRLAPDLRGGTGRGSTPDNNSAADCFILISKLQTAAADTEAAQNTLQIALHDPGNTFQGREKVIWELALAHTRLGKIEEARKLAAEYDEWFNVYGRAQLLCQIAQMQISGGDVSGGKGTFELAKQAIIEHNEKSSIPRPIVQLHCDISAALTSAGDTKGAALMLKTAEQYVVPEQRGEDLSALGVGWAKAGDFSQAKTFFALALRAATSNHYEIEQVKRAQIAANDIEGPKRNAEEMLSSKDTSGFLQIVDEFSNSNRKEVAKGLLRTAIAKKSLIDVNKDDLFSSQLNCNDFAGAGDTITEMADPSSVSRALFQLANATLVLSTIQRVLAKAADSADFASIARVQAMLGDTAGAKATAAKSPKVDDSYSLCDIGVVYSKAGDAKLAREYFEKAIRTVYPDAEQARQRPNWNDDMRVRYVIKSQAETGDIEGARNNIQFLIIESARADTHCDIATALMQSGNPHGANDEFSTATRIANETPISIFYPEQTKIDTLIKIARRQLRCFGLVPQDDNDDL